MIVLLSRSVSNLYPICIQFVNHAICAAVAKAQNVMQAMFIEYGEDGGLKPSLRAMSTSSRNPSSTAPRWLSGCLLLVLLCERLRWVCCWGKSLRQVVMDVALGFKELLLVNVCAIIFLVVAWCPKNLLSKVGLLVC